MIRQIFILIFIAVTLSGCANFAPTADRAASLTARGVDRYCELPPNLRVPFGQAVRARTDNQISVTCTGD